jgi:hypothetical protein
MAEYSSDDLAAAVLVVDSTQDITQMPDTDADALREQGRMFAQDVHKGSRKRRYELVKNVLGRLEGEGG